MKTLLAIVLVAMATPGTVDTYLASRDHAIGVLTTDPSSKAAAKTEKRALGELEKQLRHLLEPLRAEGFSVNGTINLETLIEEQGFGRLDGLVYTAPTLDTRVVVSSDALLAAWLAGRSDVPTGRDAAIASEAFYSQAIGSDAAIAAFATLPVMPKDAGPAIALLVQRRQDISPGPPDEIVGTMVRGARVFVISQHVATPVSSIPICDALRAAEQKKADAVLDAYNKGGSTDDKLFDRYTRLQDEGDVKSRRCFGDHFREQPVYAAIMRQAEALLDRLR